MLSNVDISPFMSHLSSTRLRCKLLGLGVLFEIFCKKLYATPKDFSSLLFERETNITIKLLNPTRIKPLKDNTIKTTTDSDLV